MGTRLKFIVCITGMPGAGKSTVAKSASNLGFKVVNLGDTVRDEVSKKGLDHTDANLSSVMLKLRKEYGPGAIAQLAISNVLSSSTPHVAIDGIRSMHEVEVFRKVVPVRLLAVHASPKTRYHHLQERAREDAPLEWDVFQTRDERELSIGVGVAIALSDEVVSNNNITFDELQERAYEIIRKWMMHIED